MFPLAGKHKIEDNLVERPMRKVKITLKYISK
jgi:hypothetical protein